MDLRRLEYFLAVVQHGQVTSAAAALRVAQPSLSQAIRALERDLGVELFTREGRTLRPTRAGQAMVEPARRVLRDLASAQAAVGAVVDLAAGWLDIAAHELLTRDPLAAAIAEFHHRHAGVPVRLHAARDEDDVIRMLGDGRCELALAYLPVPAAGLIVRRLGSHELWAVLPPGTSRGPDPLPIPALAGIGLVDSTRGFGAPRGAISAALREARVVVRPVVRTRHREAIIPMVLAGLGATFTTERYAREAASAGAVIRRLQPSVRNDFALLHRDATLSPAALAFVRVLVGATAGPGAPAGVLDELSATAGSRTIDNVF